MRNMANSRRQYKPRGRISRRKRRLSAQHVTLTTVPLSKWITGWLGAQCRAATDIATGNVEEPPPAGVHLAQGGEGEHKAPLRAITPCVARTRGPPLGPNAMNFASDNTAPVAPAILDALIEASHGYARGYGNDDWTHALERRFCDIFEREVAAFLVPTGTAANALALAQISPPWGAVLCHANSHIATDECGAPEFFGHGIKLVGLAGEGGKITSEGLREALAGYGGHSPHQVIPAALSLTQATEAGTIYRVREISALAEIARARSVAVHMDGARFANALVRLNTTPAEMTWRSGVDVLSFGATKGGALAAEAVIFFDPAAAACFGERRKRGGHLLSKHRFYQNTASSPRSSWPTSTTIVG
jgi:threonine aldolase